MTRLPPGVYAAGEVSGFGGGMHGYRVLEGSFLGGYLFSGGVAGGVAGRAARGGLAGCGFEQAPLVGHE